MKWLGRWADLTVRTHRTLDGVERTAVYSLDEMYRYALLIRWDPVKPPKCFIGLNPSTATELADDPTIRRGIDFSRIWGFGGLLMLNACAYRATDPKVMLSYTGDQVGPFNAVEDLFAATKLLGCGIPVAAWGKHARSVAGAFGWNRSLCLKEGMGPMDCFKVNKDGTPIHPLYQRRDAVLQPYNYTRNGAS